MPRKISEKISKQTTSGVINDSLHPAAVKIIQSLSDDEYLLQEVGALVGRYRFMCEARKTMPQPSDSKRLLQETATAIDNLRGHILAMPEEFKVLASDDLLRIRGEVYEALWGRMDQDLLLYRALCTKTAGGVESGSKGTKAKTLEYKLLSEVATLLESKASNATHAAGKAADILNSVGGIHVPASPQKALEAISSYRKQHPRN